MTMQTEAQKRDCERKRKSYPAHKAERIARATKWNSEHPEARAEGNKRHHNALIVGKLILTSCTFTMLTRQLNSSRLARHTGVMLIFL